MIGRVISKNKASNITDFIIYDIAEGIQRQNRQTMYNTEYTVQAHPKQIAVAVDWLKY